MAEEPKTPTPSGIKRPVAPGTQKAVAADGRSIGDSTRGKKPAAKEAKPPPADPRKKTKVPTRPKKKNSDAAAKKRKKAGDQDILAEKAKGDRPRYVFVVPCFDGTGSESEAYAVSVVHELARRGSEILVITGKGSSEGEHVTVRRSNPLMMGRKAIRTFKPRHIIDWGYNIPAEFRRVDSPYEQVFKHTIGACNGLTRLIKSLQLRFGRAHRHHIHKQRALMGVSRTQFLAQSNLVAEDLKNAGVERGRIHVLPYGVDLEKYAPSAAGAEAKALRKQHGFGDGEVVFLSVADDPNLVDLDLLRSTFTVIHGETSNVRLLHMGACNPGWSEAWFTHIDRPVKSEAVFAAADAFVHPAVYDACGAAVIQAMAAGLPVVTTENVGSLKLVKDSGGALFAPVRQDNAADRWTQAVKPLASDAEKRAQLGEAGRKAASQRTLQAFVDQLEDILK